MLKEWTISVEKLDGTDQIRWIPIIGTDLEAMLCANCVKRYYKKDDSVEIYLYDETDYENGGVKC